MASAGKNSMQNNHLLMRGNLQLALTVAYARRLGVGAVVRRLGYLLEHYGLADASALEPLLGMLTATYQRLDPLLPAEGAFLSRWRLQLNVTPEELDTVRLG
jgi:predicted transcriptional regulator of viral defense system